MYYGIPTLLELESIEECAELCSDLSLHFVEISMDMPIYQLHLLESCELNRIKEKYDIFYTIHLPGFMNVSDFNPLVREAWLETVRRTIRFSKEIGTKKINMHLAKGDYFTLPHGKVNLFDAYEEFYLDTIKQFVKLCEDEIDISGIKITVENTGGFTSFQKKAIEIMLNSEVFGLCYDLGHDYKHGKPDEEFVLNNKDKLYHIHFHDATENSDHLPLGEGENDLVKYLYLANEINASVVLETKTVEGLKKSVDFLANTPMPIMEQYGLFEE